MNCSASVNQDTALHTNLSALGFQAGGCTLASEGRQMPVVFSAAGTNTVEVGGSATLSYGGGSQTVAITSGRFTVTAPETSCTSLETTCETQIDQVELSFGAFTLPGFAAQTFTIASTDRALTPSGQRLPPEPPAIPDPAFLFLSSVPQYAFFDAIGVINNVGQGFHATTSTESHGTIDLSTGEIGFDVSLHADLGQPFTINGHVTTTKVIDQAPIVTVPESASVVAPADCSASVTLTASAASPLGLPVTLEYVVDSQLVGSGESVSTTMGVGTHVVTVVGIDSLGAQSSATEMVTVTGDGCP
jgi:hypothetical protein